MFNFVSGVIEADFSSSGNVRVKGYLETIGKAFDVVFQYEGDRQDKDLFFEIQPQNLDFFKLPNVVSELKIWTEDGSFKYIHDAEPQVMKNNHFMCHNCKCRLK